MSQSPPTVYIVDDDPGVRRALTKLLASAALRAVCFASAQEFLARRRGEVPSCLVLDASLPGVSGMDLQRELVRDGQNIPIIFISAHGDIPTAVRAIKAGAVEFLTKPFSDHDLFQAIREALDRDREQRSQHAGLALIRARQQTLTRREREVMARLIRGCRNKQIAAELGLSENTVKVHRHNLMEKMGAATLAELIHMIGRIR